MIGNLDSVKVLVFVFAITLLTSFGASDSDGSFYTDAPYIGNVTLGPGDQKIVAKATVENEEKDTNDGFPVEIDYFKFNNGAQSGDASAESVDNASIWYDGSKNDLLGSNSSGDIGSPGIFIGSDNETAELTVVDGNSETLYFSLTASQNIDASDDGEYVGLKADVDDIDENDTSTFSSTPEISWGTEATGRTYIDARPEITKAETVDSDGDGKLEAINLTFSEEVRLQDSKGTEDALPGVAVDGYELVNKDYNGQTGKSHLISISNPDLEADAGDTGQTPSISFNGSSNIVDSDQLENNARSFDNFQPADGAEPVLIEHSYWDENDDGDIDIIDLRFSESVEGKSDLNKDEWSFPTNPESLIIDKLSWRSKNEINLTVFNVSGTSLQETSVDISGNGSISDGRNAFEASEAPYTLSDDADPVIQQGGVKQVSSNAFEVTFSEQVQNSEGSITTSDFAYTGGQTIESIEGTAPVSSVTLSLDAELTDSNVKTSLEDTEFDTVDVAEINSESALRDETGNSVELGQNVPVRASSNNESNNDSESNISLNEFVATYEEPENLPDGFKGVISTEFNTTEALDNVSMNLNNSDGAVKNYALNSTKLNKTPEGTYFGGILVPEDSSLEGDYTLEVASLNDVEVDATEDVRTESVKIGSSGYSILGLEASTKDSQINVQLGVDKAIDSYVIVLEDDDGREIGGKERLDPQGETLEDGILYYETFENLEAGEYEVQLRSVNQEEVEGFSAQACIEDDFHCKESEDVSVDDFFTNTTTDYSVASAFLDHVLKVTADQGVFSLIDGEQNVEETVNVSEGENFTTSDLEEDRYILNNSDGNISKIDLFKPDSDIISRLENFSNPEIRMFEYERMEEVDTESDRINISELESWEGSQQILRMNTSLEKYWIQIDGDDNTVAEASRTAREERLERCDEYTDDEEELESDGSTGGESDSSTEDDECVKGELKAPYVQDFETGDGFNVSGQVYDSSSQNGSVSDLKLRLVKNEFDYTLDEERGPLRESPPIITTMTDESGEYKFEDVPAAGYNLYVVNESWAPVKGSQYFEPEIRVTGDISSESLAVTDKTGTLNLTIDGPQKDFVYGYNLNRVDEIGWYSQLGIGAGETNITLPTGEYYVGIGRQSLTGETPSQRTLGKVNVTEDGLTNISTSYADTVYLNGSVKQDGTILDIDDAYVSIRSKGDREQRKGYWTRVEDGEFSRKVAENTNYTVRLSPPYQSSYTDKERDIQVNESSKILNFSLETGKYIAGEIQAKGEPVEARVRVSNSSNGIWRNTETEDGVYNITGLKNGSYDIRVQPRSPRYTESSKQVTLSDESKSSVDFDLGGSTAVLNGTVSFEGEGSPEGVEVEVEAEDPFVKDREQELGSDGVYSFEVPEDTYYSIEVEGEVNGEEKEKRKTRYLSGDETVDFEFETLQKFEGVVKTDDGERIQAWIGARNYSERSRDFVRTGENGRFELELAEAPHKVVIEPHPSESVGPDETTVTKQEIIDGKNFTYDLSSYTYLEGEVDFQGINTSEGFIAVGNESAKSFNYQKLQNDSFNLTGLKDVGHRVFVASRQGDLREEFTIGTPNELGNAKNFTLGETAKKKVIVRTHSGSDTGPIEPNVTVQTRQSEETTNSSGEAVFKVDPRSTSQFYVDKDGFRSNIREITVDGDTGSTREVDIGINQTQEYSVRINVSKEGNNESDINPPASVVFVSRDNQSAEGGSVTVNTEGARPSIEGLTTGDYLVGVAEGPEREYVNRTAEIPEEDPLSQTDTVNMTDSDGGIRYTVWYEVTQ